MSLNHKNQIESFISVDVETAGPNPGHYSLLSIGACTVIKPRKTFYIELKPVNDNAKPEALAISGLTLEGLKEKGTLPEKAMSQFADWVVKVVPKDIKPIFVAFNAPFDWMFVNDYFYRYLGKNPFGYSALDIKALYMGLEKASWSETKMRYLGPRYLDGRELSHNALQDAIDQADILEKLLVLIKTAG
jgi:DNA polymerase III epsilon subunit-like protein